MLGQPCKFYLARILCFRWGACAYGMLARATHVLSDTVNISFEHTAFWIQNKQSGNMIDYRTAANLGASDRAETDEVRFDGPNTTAGSLLSPRRVH